MNLANYDQVREGCSFFDEVTQTFILDLDNLNASGTYGESDVERLSSISCTKDLAESDAYVTVCLCTHLTDFTVAVNMNVLTLKDLANVTWKNIGKYPAVFITVVLILLFAGALCYSGHLADKKREKSRANKDVLDVSTTLYIFQFFICVFCVISVFLLKIIVL